VGEVLYGFAVVWVVIVVGIVLGRTEVLGPDARRVLSRTAFFVGSPTLMFVTLRDSDPGLLASEQMVVAAASALGTGLVTVLVGRFLLRRGFVETVVLGISGSVCNAANMGFPVALYVLGSIEHAAPVMLFQLAVYTPIYLMLLDAGTRGVRPSLRTVAGSVLRNPMIIAAALGVAVSASGLRIPDEVMVPVEQLAGLSIPTMLLAFGLSLSDQPPTRAMLRSSGDTLVASGAKLLLMPALAWLVGGPLLRMEPHDLFAVVVMASLPTAQNVFVAASRYQAGEKIARDTVLVTTVLSVAVVGAASALLG
jgi:malonate transporter and related proteins